MLIDLDVNPAKLKKRKHQTLPAWRCRPPCRLLAIDPALNTTGYAAIDVRDDDLGEIEWAGYSIDLADAGTISTPDCSGSGSVETRLIALQHDIYNLCQDFGPDLTIIETAGDHVGGPKHGTKGVTRYAMAVGAALVTASRLSNIAGVSAHDWARGKLWGKIDARVAFVGRLFPSRYRAGYEAKSGDAATSVCLALWWLDRHPAHNGGRSSG